MNEITGSLPESEAVVGDADVLDELGGAELTRLRGQWGRLYGISVEYVRGRLTWIAAYRLAPKGETPLERWTSEALQSAMRRDWEDRRKAAREGTR
jgi:hypothetical protein